MLLRYVAGRAGSGKSTWVYEAVKRDLDQSGRPVWIVVPEQYTLQTEKELLASLGRRGFLQARVSSPTRLANEVFAQVEQSRKTAVGETGLAMAFSASAARIAGELQAFAPVLGFQGFSLGMVRLISEMKRFDVSPEQLESAAEAARGALKAKTLDIAMLYRAYGAFLASRDYVDAEDRFNGFVASIRKAEFLLGCPFYFDGFDALPPQHCRMIGELLAIVPQVTVTLDYDGFESADSGLFHAAEANIARLGAIAKDLGAGVQWVHVRAGDRANAMPPDVAHLERSLFSWPAAVKPAEGGVTLCRASCAEEESEAAAAFLTDRVCRENIRWREVAVQCGDLQAYAPVVARVFERWGIPVFVDSRKAIAGHPAVRFLLALLRVVERDFRADDVLRLVKTGFAGVPQDEADRLEVWLTAFAPRGARAWSREWQKGQDTFDIAALNRSRAAVYGLVADLLRQAGGKTVPAAQWAAALFSLMREIKLDERLDAQAAMLKREGLLEEAAVTERVWNAAVDIIDQLHEIVGGETMDAAGFRAVLQSGFESVEEGILPTGVDQVQVGSIGRSKYSGLKYMMILGAGEGLSDSSANSGVLTRRDVDALAELGVELGCGSDLSSSQKRFALYQAAAKGSRGLYISWPSVSASGQEAKPDRFVEDVMRLLDIGRDGVTDASAMIAAPAPAAGRFERLAVKLRRAAEGTEPDAALPAELQWFLRSSEYRGRVNALLAGVAGEAEAGTLKAAGAAMGGVPSVSATQLASYWNCPFQHFAQYLLAPQPWREHGVEGPDAGLFLHAAMERFGAGLLASRADLAALGEEEAVALMGQEAAALAEEFRYGLLKGSPRLEWTGGNLRRMAGLAAAAYARQMKAGAFLPLGQEVRFGRGGIPAAPIAMPDGSLCFLQGRIDRLDVARLEGGDFLRVVDYKSGAASVDVYHAVNGLDMQTWLYLYALGTIWGKVSGRPPRPAGAFVFPLADPWAEDGEGAEDERRKGFRMKGWCLDDSRVLRAMDEAAGAKSGLYQLGKGSLHKEKVVSAALELVAGNAAESVQRIRQGHVAARPWRNGKDTACARCDWAPLCRFHVRETKQYRPMLGKETIDAMLGIAGEGGRDAMDE